MNGKEVNSYIKSLELKNTNPAFNNKQLLSSIQYLKLNEHSIGVKQCNQREFDNLNATEIATLTAMLYTYREMN